MPQGTQEALRRWGLIACWTKEKEYDLGKDGKAAGG